MQEILRVGVPHWHRDVALGGDRVEAFGLFRADSGGQLRKDWRSTCNRALLLAVGFQRLCSACFLISSNATYLACGSSRGARRRSRDLLGRLQQEEAASMLKARTLRQLSPCMALLSQHSLKAHISR